MTLVSLPSPIHWPGILGNISSAPGYGNSLSFTTAGHYMAYIFCAKEDMVVSHVAFRCGTATGSPTVDIRIETVDATGMPSGTLWATNTNATSATLSANASALTALTASATITKGQVFCVKIAYASGTNFTVATIGHTTLFQSSLPYQVTNAGTPTKAQLSSTATIALGSNSTTFYFIPGCLPASAFTSGVFNNTSSAKRGLRFTPPMNCRVIGMRFYNSSSAGDFNAIIFSDAGSELSTSSTAFDGDHNAATTVPISVYFDNPVTLTAGTTYRAAIEPSTATNVNVSTMTLVSSSYRSASPAGTTAHYTLYNGSWDDTNTTLLPLLDIIIDQIDDGAGSGGGGTTVIGVIGG